jgi:glucose/arabinose dehydrogenase
VIAEEKLLLDPCKRMKDVSQGPDGAIYLVTDMSPSDILRIGPAGK